MSAARKLAVNMAKHLMTQIIKQPAEDRADEFLANNTSTARLLWSCQEVIDNAEDWKISKLHRELGIIMGMMIARDRTVAVPSAIRIDMSMTTENCLRSDLAELKSTEVRDE